MYRRCFLVSFALLFLLSSVVFSVFSSDKAFATSFTAPVSSCGLTDAQINTLLTNAESTAGGWDSAFDMHDPTSTWIIGKSSWINSGMLLIRAPTGHVTITSFSGGYTDIQFPDTGQLYMRFNETDYSRISNILSTAMNGSWSCVQGVHNANYAQSGVTTDNQTFTELHELGYSPPPVNCTYNSSILASDPNCRPPCPYDSNLLDNSSFCIDPNQNISFIQKVSVMIAFTISGIIAYQFRFRGTR